MNSMKECENRFILCGFFLVLIEFLHNFSIYSYLRIKEYCELMLKECL